MMKVYLSNHVGGERNRRGVREASEMKMAVSGREGPKYGGTIFYENNGVVREAIGHCPTRARRKW